MRPLLPLLLVALGCAPAAQLTWQQPLPVAAPTAFTETPSYLATPEPLLAQATTCGYDEASQGRCSVFGSELLPFEGPSVKSGETPEALTPPMEMAGVSTP